MGERGVGGWQGVGVGGGWKAKGGLQLPLGHRHAVVLHLQ